jgi:hypothetical protein
MPPAVESNKIWTKRSGGRRYPRAKQPCNAAEPATISIFLEGLVAVFARR